MASVFRARYFWWVLVGVLLLSALLLSGFFRELLWMQAVGYAPVFWEILGLQVLLFAGAFVVSAGYLGVNLFMLIRQIPPLWASRWAQEGQPPTMGGLPLTRGRLRWVAGAVSLFIGLSYGGGFATQWDNLLRFLSDETHGLADPIFGHDAAFYMLRLPFVDAVQGALVSLAFLTLFALVVVYVLMGEVEVRGGRVAVRPSVVRHLAVNVLVLLAGWTAGFFLDRYDLLTEPGAVVWGVGYVEDRIVRPALWVMMAASVGLAVLVLLTLRRYRFRWLAYGLGAYVVLWIVALGIVPGAVHQFVVEPNELELERPYIEHNIAFTRAAYRLDEVEVQPYAARPGLTPEQVQQNMDALRTVRLWDQRLLLDTYSQVQEIRTYYEFYHVDIDRYRIDGEYRQVMIAARELTQDLPGNRDTWLNRHLQYTHGYGAVVSLAADKDDSGLPVFRLRNVPPETEYPALRVDEPAIYYGEETPTYRIVDTGAQELDYPQGDENVYTTYDGTGGVLLSSFWRQLLFAWTFSDYNIVLSDYITGESRIQFWNRVQERVRQIAPFLELDSDPYLVIADERYYWVQDAYTTAADFPYSEPARPGLSYLRNSVKIVIDAYSGAVDFYAVQPDDPVLGVYQSAFPDMFQPLSAMSEVLQEHLRYPRDVFGVQIRQYRRYHMTNPRVFYNSEDLWALPMEQYAGQSARMEPYYVLTRLPEREQLEFLLMIPFTPANRDNMIGWMAARSDAEDYGDLIVFELPKDRLIYGPAQVEARIDQSTEISRQLSLWDQRGSRVIRGHLIVIPIEEASLYVEPVFLVAEETGLPQLRRVIAAYGEQVAMRRTLEGALAAVLNIPLAGREPVEPGAPVAAAASPGALEDAREALEEAQQALRAGDFAGFGAAFDRLGTLITEPDTAQAVPPAAPVDTTGTGAE